jgi:outer membrane PBP1 activator LpoA protein
MRLSADTMRFAHIALRAGVITIAAAAALSCAPLAPTSRPAPIVERNAVRPAPPPFVAPQPPPPVPEALTTPLAPLPPIETAPETPPTAPFEPRSARPPAPSIDAVALILPLDVPAYARAADAVRAGFLAAADAVGQRAKCIVIGHKEDGVLAAFEEARKRGVRVIVGPLLRDDLKTLVLADPEIPWTIALNQLDDRAPMPAAVYSFALTIEADAHLLARRARYDGVHAIDVIAGDPPIMKRLATTFAGDWIASGGAPPADLHFDPAPEMLSQLRRNLARAAPDAVLLAVDGNHAALVKSYVGALPAYASGLVFERPDPAVVRDLNDVRVAEIPWLVTPDAPQFANYPRRDFGSAALDRLYALGLDAFRVSEAFGLDPPERFTLEGATGTIELDAGHQFVREGRLGVYRDGRLVPLDTAPR